jgi:hypothetical protein
VARNKKDKEKGAKGKRKQKKKDEALPLRAAGKFSDPVSLR